MEFNLKMLQEEFEKIAAEAENREKIFFEKRSAEWQKSEEGKLYQKKTYDLTVIEDDLQAVIEQIEAYCKK